MPYSEPSPVSKNQVLGSRESPSNSSLQTSVSASPGDTSLLSNMESVVLLVLTFVCGGTTRGPAISTSAYGVGRLPSSQAANRNAVTRIRLLRRTMLERIDGSPGMARKYRVLTDNA